MLILPLIDLLILLGSFFLVMGVLLKSIVIFTSFRPMIAGFTSIDFVVLAGVCLSFSLVLAARTWVKLNEPTLNARREVAEAEIQQRVRALGLDVEDDEYEDEDEEIEPAGVFPLRDR